MAVVSTLLCGLVYLAVQQSLRWGANDPQIQMAEDAAAVLTGGQQPESVLPANHVELSTSLAPFMVIYDNTGQPLASTGYLNDSFPLLPVGVFEYTSQNDEDRITWQPAPGVRMAAVVVKYNSTEPGFVLAARSLREVEQREDQVEKISGFVWVVTLVASLIIVAGCEWLLVDHAKSD
jgi:hypothetical protein